MTDRSTQSAGLRDAAAEPFLIDGIELVLSAAVGGCPAYVADPVDLLREADQRMYETKRRRTAEAVPGSAAARAPGWRADESVSARADHDALTRDSKQTYTAPTAEAAEFASLDPTGPATPDGVGSR